MQPKIFILDTIEKLESFKEYVSENSFAEVAFDLETNDKMEAKAITWGIGLTFDGEEAFYIPVRTKTAELYFDKAVVDGVVNFVSSTVQSKRIITHNGLYDILVWEYNTGVDLTASLYADTILYKHLVDEERPFGLKETAVKYLGAWADKAQEALYENIKANGGSTTKDNTQMWKADTEVLGEYCCFDVILTYRLYKLFRAKIEAEGLVELLETETMPLYRNVTIAMKRKGVTLDIEMFLDKKNKITDVILDVEREIITEVQDLIEPFITNLLIDEFPIKKTGNFPKAYAKQLGWDLPSMAKKEILKLTQLQERHPEFTEWVLDKELPEDMLDAHIVNETRRAMWAAKYPEDPYIFNLSSKAHLKWLFFEKLGKKPLSKTPSGEPQVDDAFLETVNEEYPWVALLQDYNVLNKTSGTYIQGMLDREVKGTLYTSFLQFGTTSGRFASSNPNLQNFSSPQNTGRVTDEFVNCIRNGLIARPGYKFIGLDFSSLEPHIAAYVSGDPGLIDIFVTGKDFYSAIGVKQFNRADLSPFKEDSNYLGTKEKALRDKIKTYALAAFYGAEAPRIAQVLKSSKEEAHELLDGYLTSFPDIKEFIDRSHYDALNKGYVKTIFGRVRHLETAKHLHEAYGHDLLNWHWAKRNNKLEERGILRNLLNNAVNFQIQGTAGHIMNRAMLKTVAMFEEHGIVGYPVMQVHDEQILEVREDHVEKAAAIAKQAMETAVNLDPIKLKATPVIGNSYGECK